MPFPNCRAAHSLFFLASSTLLRQTGLPCLFLPTGQGPTQLGGSAKSQARAIDFRRTQRHVVVNNLDRRI
jgi:hypothetical protein